jgi:hypothetical protein
MWSLLLTLVVSQVAGMATARLFGPLTSLINMPALYVARRLRGSLGATRTWTPGLYTGAGMAWAGRAVTTILVPLTVFLYFAMPSAADVTPWVAAGAIGSLFAIWVPGMFVMALSSADA